MLVFDNFGDADACCLLHISVSSAHELKEHRYYSLVNFRHIKQVDGGSELFNKLDVFSP